MMKILDKLRKIFSLDRKTLFLFLEAFLYLGWARCLIYMPFAKVAPLLGNQMQETPGQIDIENSVFKRISGAIAIISNHTFWECKCLVKAIAAMKMLERRGIGSTLYLGTAKDETGELIAHAWLRSGPFFITGAEVMNRFTVVGKFAKTISNDK